MLRQIGAVLLSAGLAATIGMVEVVDAEDAEGVVSVRVSPKISLDPGFVTVAIRHVPNDDDRGLRIEIDSPDLLRSSYIGLEGAEAASVHSIEFKNLPAGAYVVRVWLERGEASPPPSQGNTFYVAGSADEP